ncbi:ROK family protein [Paenibacillus sp. P96]|uniref:ROK family protein n=1 Tax=Paenibacillus zeirhizosphaerae TaxID=2987519 RepID=A0ABT9FX96_9BACL|nr:ROK family protein [Paenibacillus sp. P96]MDP4099260.1 ROK family protein [Paenibacillus sp. P96]
MADKAIGIDIGGTSVKGAVIGRDGTVYEEFSVATNAARGRDALLLCIEEGIRPLLHAWPEVRSLGIASAGRVNADTGEVVYATDNLPRWQGVRLFEWAWDSFGLKAAADNDANAALVGEAWLGAATPQEQLVLLTLGTGVGGAYIHKGELCRGKRWSGGEWGHSILVPGGMACNCGKRGCVEQYVSGTALNRRALAVAGGRYASSHVLLEAAHLGDALALKEVRAFLQDLAVVIVNIYCTLDPDAVILGGGIADSSAVWWEWLEEELEGYEPGMKVRQASLGNRAGFLGAAKLAFDQEDHDLDTE